MRNNLLAKALATTLVILHAGTARAQLGTEPAPLPPELTKEQREHLRRFLQKHEKPDRFIPPNARVIGPQGAAGEIKERAAPTEPVKQYTVQITPHRPVPGQDQVQRVDVYYYRPHPERGKLGITVKHTVDVTTGQQVGPTEVLLNYHSPLSREELAEAVVMAREKSADVQALYKNPANRAVRWEPLQLMIQRPNGQFETGDRAVRLVFRAFVAEGEPPQPVRVLVNLTKGVVVKDDR